MTSIEAPKTEPSQLSNDWGDSRSAESTSYNARAYRPSAKPADKTDEVPSIPEPPVVAGYVPPKRLETAGGLDGSSSEILLPPVAPADPAAPLKVMISSGDATAPLQIDKPAPRVVSTEQVPRATSTVESPPLQYEVETRAPGSGWVLPANPLTDLTDDKLEAFIDCTVYEDDEALADSDLLELPREGKKPDAAATPPPTPPPPATPPSAPAASLAATLAASASSGPVKGREQISTTLGVAPLSAKVDAPIVTPSQPPKPFVRATAVRPAVGEPEEAKPAAATTAAPGVAKTPPPIPATAVTPVAVASKPVMGKREMIIAGAAAVALVLVVVLASSMQRSHKAQATPVSHPTEPASPPPQQPPPPVQQPQQQQQVAPEPQPDKQPDKPGKQAETGKTCRLVIETDPAGAWIRIDHAYAGKSPLTSDGKCGKRKIEVAANGFENEVRYVQTKQGEDTKATFVLYPEKKDDKKPATPATPAGKQPSTPAGKQPSTPAGKTPTKPKGQVDI